MLQNSWVEFTPREIYPKLLNWIDEREIIALAGPRQVGKTTLLLKLKEELKNKRVVYASLEDSGQLSAFVRAPRDFISLQLSPRDKTYFLLDEFQYVKNGGKILKFLFDEFPQAKFVITGSSSLKIRHIASYLVGRVIFFNLYPFSFAEFLNAKDITLFKLWQRFHSILENFLEDQPLDSPKLIFEEKLKNFFEEYLTFGGYPAVVTSSPDKKGERLTALIETYIEKDIVKFLQIGNFVEFRNLSNLLSAQIGNLVNVSSISRDLNLPYRELKKFLGALEKTFVIKLLPPYFTNKITEIKKSPKIYFLDLGLRNALIGEFRAVDLRTDKGASVENFVLQNLFYRGNKDSFNFWRTKQRAEMDFIIKKQNEIIPIEVKYQELKKPQFSRSFSSFIEAYQPKKAVILSKNYFQMVKLKQTTILFLPIYFV